jgi:hypothetical protein
MIRIHTTEAREPPIRWLGKEVTLVGSRVDVGWHTPRWSWAASYERPTRVESPNVAGDRIAIHDPVMLARLLAIALPVIARIWRLIR